jgi:hypothetical protein
MVFQINLRLNFPNIYSLKSIVRENATIDN